MRVLIRIAVGVVVLLGAALLALAVLLPRWVESAGFRETLNEIARERLGREVSYSSVAVRLLPPRVEAADLRVSGSKAGDPPSVEAERAGLVLSWGGLLRGQAVVDALTIEGARLRIVRTPKGLDWIAAALPAAPAASRAPEPAGAGSAVPGDSSVAIRRVQLRSSEISFDDRVARPPVVWTFGDLDLRARGDALDQPIAFDVTGTLASGGAVEGAGTFATSGASDAEISLRGFDLSPLRSYTEALEALGGHADVGVRLERAEDGSLKIDFSAASDDAAIRSGDLGIAGPLSASGKLAGPVDALRGPFELDATRAKLDYAGGSYRKPAGTRAKLSGTLTFGKDGATADYELQIRNAKGSGSLRTAPRTRLEIRTEDFDLEGWEELAASLESLKPDGNVAIEGLVLQTEPLALDGTVALRAVEIEATESGRVTLQGFVDAKGSKLRFRALEMKTPSASVGLEGGLDDVFGSQRLLLRAATPAPVESNALFSLVDSLRNSIFGPLDLDLDIAAPLSGDASLLRSVNGKFRFQLGGDTGRGRVEGVSILRSVFGQLGALGQGALLAMPLKRGKSLEEYYSEDFLRASGNFLIGGGKARTQDFEIVHEKYRVALTGSLGLEDLELDMTGEVGIGEEIDAALSGGRSRRKRTIPLARLVGPLTKPRVQLRPDDVARFASAYLLEGALGDKAAKIEKSIDTAAGAGTSDLLRGVLGLGRREPGPPASPPPPDAPPPTPGTTAPSEPAAPPPSTPGSGAEPPAAEPSSDPAPDVGDGLRALEGLLRGTQKAPPAPPE